MKTGNKKQLLTEKETELMNILWDHGPLFVREIVDLYPEPRPHFNTVATLVRILETKGFTSHEAIGSSHRFRAIVDRSILRERSLAKVVSSFFGNSYKMAVSSLVEEEKISLDELKEIISLIEQKNGSVNFESSNNID